MRFGAVFGERKIYYTPEAAEKAFSEVDRFGELKQRCDGVPARLLAIAAALENATNSALFGASSFVSSRNSPEAVRTEVKQ